MKPLEFAIAGCGLMGRRHAEILRSIPGCNVTWLFDRAIDQAKSVARKGERVTNDYDSLVNADNVDAVVICLPSHLHAEYGIAAAHVRKHVIVEKPIDSSTAAAKHLIEECIRQNVVCAVISQYRFADGYRALKQAIDNEVLSTPLLARASIKWYRHDEYYTGSEWRGRIEGEGGGVLINQAIHAIDMLLWYFGIPKSVSGFLATNRQVLDGEDTAVLALKFQGGLLATLEASTSAYPGVDDQFEVHSMNAMCGIRHGQIVAWHHEGNAALPQPSPLPDLPEGFPERYILFFRQYRNIIAAIRGEESLVVTPQQSLSAVEIVQRVYATLR